MRGAKYDALVDEVIGALRERYGRALLIHWEDFAARNSFRLLAKYQAQVHTLVPMSRAFGNLKPGSWAANVCHQCQQALHAWHQSSHIMELCDAERGPDASTWLA